jgi:zinc transport system substrate-binding protein
MIPSLFRHARHVLAGASLCVFACFPATAKQLDVVATIAPIHSLTAAVMKGVGEPHLLLQGGASGHTYSMKPSDAERLQRADVIVQVSEAYEVFLQKALKTLPKSAKIITLDEIEGLTLLPVREGGDFEAHSHGDHGHGHKHGHGHGKKEHGHGKKGHGHGHGHAHGEADHDVHIWFDIGNAKIMAQHIAEVLGKIAPEHASTFKANADALVARLDALDAETREALAASKGKPFVVFHDVLQYFENRYGLTTVGAITLSPERQPGAKRVAEVRKKLDRLKAVCVFAEPQFSPKLVDTIVEGTKVRKGTLDEIGVGLEPGPELYFEFIRMNVRGLNDCLAVQS